MCRWMGSHFCDWFNYNGVAFSIELLEWGNTFSDFLGKTCCVDLCIQTVFPFLHIYGQQTYQNVCTVGKNESVLYQHKPGQQTFCNFFLNFPCLVACLLCCSLMSIFFFFGLFCGQGFLQKWMQTELLSYTPYLFFSLPTILCLTQVTVI